MIYFLAQPGGLGARPADKDCLAEAEASAAHYYDLRTRWVREGGRACNVHVPGVPASQVYVCTRPHGHRPPHISGSLEKIYARWTEDLNAQITSAGHNASIPAGAARFLNYYVPSIGYGNNEG